MHFATTFEILITQNPNEKISKFEQYYKKFKNGEISFEESFEAKELQSPSYDSFTHQILPKEAQKRNRLDTVEGKILLLHTIAHIEYSAIDLALDAACRFTKMPMKFYEDWLEVAEDEIRHFLMVTNLLGELGANYGDLAVHNNLFLAMQKTPNLIDRMAIVPRYLEANGLEQNPKIIKKLDGTPDAFNQKIKTALNVILEEEIDHVKKGDFWFRFECDRLHLEPQQTYLEILEKFYPGSTQKTYDLNFEARKKAGFSCEELKKISKKQECK